MAGDTPLLALLPSPLLGPATWTPVADRLHAAGHRVVVTADDGQLRSASDVLAALATFADRLPLGPTVLIAHSNAGAFVPALSARRDVVAAVFVDAVLPGARAQPMAPPGMVDFLRGLADHDGVLPVWTQWWDPADVAPLFPDEATRVRVATEQRRAPMSYFESSVEVPPDWATLPTAYLAFGDTYAAEYDRACSDGRPTLRLAGHHLHQLVDPAAVTAGIERLLSQLSYPSA